MWKKIVAGTVLLLISGLWAFVKKHDTSKISAISLSNMEQKLDARVRNPIKEVDAELAQVGYTLITEGKANYKEHKGKLISSYFVCTDCHNLNREYSTLTEQSPEDKLKYTTQNNLPFLPASSFYGIYNRKQFYTKDYVKKYGELVNDARDTLENAVQLCAKYCSSGRYLEDWELSAILHYYKSTELKVGDLNLTHKELTALEHHDALSTSEKEELKKSMQSKFTQAYIATFLPAMDVNKRGYGAKGDAENGKLIYENSCLHCHDNARVTYLDLDKSKLDAQMFWKNIDNYTDKSLYQIIRYGTYPIAGRKQYMPLYPEEKMSNQQLEDLVAYIKQLAEVK
ncbi:Cytochrome C oxidase, cbb3-type, subunit III [Lishizhenia tianjinensis]|uniref:Cytochrome C oxidase, cbb3-type, subunit III n=1 Tax=Lishizhenia tianjinensis TaxID=477690 RepID=A0A1I7AQT8_9FLAO|nr:cytochrome c [Lishizhenia tianjinensis]SFT77255.1 Cytochrome C oxidase, cbb3-type, subunit III [Lishizhenia tianjinensis]